DAGLIIAATLLLAALSVWCTRRYLPRAYGSARTSIAAAWRHARAQRPGTLLRALGWTLGGFLVRGAVLPVLLARTPGLSLGGVLLGSAVLVYGQQLAPTPGGIGAVELGAVVGFGARIGPGALALLVVIWRTYTLALGALAGALLLMRARTPALTPSPSTPAPFRAAS
ncbi:MAG TPA: lysylphosphatidylglycerol synthase domain-containing protein, partial [Gemmatimonadales bacterium]